MSRLANLESRRARRERGEERLPELMQPHPNAVGPVVTGPMRSPRSPHGAPLRRKPAVRTTHNWCMLCPLNSSDRFPLVVLQSYNTVRKHCCLGPPCVALGPCRLRPYLPDPLPTHTPHTWPPCRDVATACWSHDPHNRPTAAELVNVLQLLLNQVGAGAGSREPKGRGGVGLPPVSGLPEPGRGRDTPASGELTTRNLHGGGRWLS